MSLSYRRYAAVTIVLLATCSDRDAAVGADGTFEPRSNPSGGATRTLKAAMAHRRELLSRLELAVASATGCTRGTYAPEPR